jgi:hypothetical protein
VITKSAFNHGF